MGNLETNYQALMAAIKDSGLAEKGEKQYKRFVPQLDKGTNLAPVGKLADVTGAVGQPLDTGFIYVENCRTLDIMVKFAGAGAVVGTNVNIYEIGDDDVAEFSHSALTTANSQFGFRVIVGHDVAIGAGMVQFDGGLLNSPLIYALPILVKRRIGVAVNGGAGAIPRVVVYGRE